MTGIIGEGLGNGETPGAEPTAPQLPQRLVDVRALIVAVELGQEPPPLSGGPPRRTDQERELGAAALPREEMPDGDTAVDQVSTGTKPARQQARQDLKQTHRFL